MIKRNAIIMAAGTSSRFVPLSSEFPKGLLEVKGEILIERQIRQLQEAGIDDIVVVIGYKFGLFEYLRNKFGIRLVLNDDFFRYNNTSSLIRVVDSLRNTYICSSDNYFKENVFLEEPKQSFYSALYANGNTNEYCLFLDDEDNIKDVSIGGRDSWYMVGHVYFSEDFSKVFGKLLKVEYQKEETKLGYWEDLYIKHINELPLLKVRRYSEHEIKEFDTLDELRKFDNTYVADTRSSVLKNICKRKGWKESEISAFTRVRHDGNYLMFDFLHANDTYRYNELEDSIAMI